MDKDSGMNTFLAFVDSHKRIVAVGVIGIILVILLGISLTREKTAPTGIDQEFADQSENEELVALLEEYYEAYADGDVKAVEKIAYPLSKKEKSYIRLMSKYIKSYDVDKIYSKGGLEKDDLLLSVEVGIHYRKLKKKAPGLDFFYMQKNEEGKYYINNLYSTFNTQNGELDTDPSYTSLIASYEQQPDVVELQNKVSQEFNKITLSNKKFNVYFTKTLPEVVTNWASDYKKQQDKAEAKNKKKKKEEEKTAKADKKSKSNSEDKEEADDKKSKSSSDDKKSVDDADSGKKASDEEESSEKKQEKKEEVKKTKAKKKPNQKETAEETVYAKADVNVRAKPSTSSRVVAHVDSGTRLLRYTTKKGWSQIRYNGEKCWIKSDYLTNKTSSSSKKKSASAGRTVRMSTSVNIRNKRNTKSSIVAAVHDGDLVDVVKNYKDGWSKVKFEGKIGYMKTEFLK